MVTRRRILQGGLVLGGVAALAPQLGRLIFSSEPQLALIIDRRVPHFAKLGSLADRSGQSVLLCDHDCADVSQEWQRRWRAAPSLLIGGSLASTAFVMEQIALRNGLHFIRGTVPEEIVARMAGPGSAEAISELNATRPEWKDRGIWWCASPVPAGALTAVG